MLENVQIVVTLPDCDKGGDNVVTWSVLIIERSVAEPMGEGVDTECRVVNK